MKRLVRFIALSFLALAASPRAARSDPAATSTPMGEGSLPKASEARRRFQQGVELYREGDLDGAFAEFQRSYDLSPNYRVLYNLAQIEVDRHDPLAALRLYRDYLEKGGTELDPERVKQVERAIEQQSKRVARIWVTSNVTGATLRLDGALASPLPLVEALAVNAGAHTLTLEKPGYATASQSITIAGSVTYPVSFELVKLTAAPFDGMGRTDGAAATRAHSNLSAGFWVSAISTGVLAGTAVSMGLLASRENQKLDHELGLFPASPERLDEERTKVKRFATLTDSFGIAALLGLTISTYLALRSPDEPAKASAVASISGLRRSG